MLWHVKDLIETWTPISPSKRINPWSLLRDSVSQSFFLKASFRGRGKFWRHYNVTRVFICGNYRNLNVALKLGWQTETTLALAYRIFILSNETITLFEISEYYQLVEPIIDESLIFIESFSLNKYSHVPWRLYSVSTWGTMGTSLLSVLPHTRQQFCFKFRFLTIITWPAPLSFPCASWYSKL